MRPLANELQRQRFEVWFDEFTLTAGMSLRRSIDFGLTKSRFGIVVFSPRFFGKNWPEWELNGLVQRHLAGTRSSILPIWHGVQHEDVMRYSPSLADIVAIPSHLGIARVVERLRQVIRPEGSALVSARDRLIDYGFEPPVISDDWWLDVIEAVGWQNERRWFLPVWQMTSDSGARGEQLAWSVMQHLWQERAEEQPISQITPPRVMLQFIEEQPGLLELARAMPRAVLEHAPQLSIRGFGGILEKTIEMAYQESLDVSPETPDDDGPRPVCDELFALRHPTFGNHTPETVACGFVQSNSFGLGPHSRAFDTIDYLVWLLSVDSEWLPLAHHAYILEGMKEWAMWPWWWQSNYESEHNGALYSSMMEALDNKRAFKLADRALLDLKERIEYSVKLLHLTDSTEDLVRAFLGQELPQSWFEAQARRRTRRRRKQS